MINTNQMLKIETNSILIKNPKILFIYSTILGFICLYLVSLVISPYQQNIGKVINAKGALLEIITITPFLFLYLFIINYIVKYFAKKKSIFFNDDEIIFIGKFNKKIKRSEVLEVHFVENKCKSPLSPTIQN